LRSQLLVSSSDVPVVELGLCLTFVLAIGSGDGDANKNGNKVIQNHHRTRPGASYTGATVSIEITSPINRNSTHAATTRPPHLHHPDVLPRPSPLSKLSICRNAHFNLHVCNPASLLQGINYHVSGASVPLCLSINGVLQHPFVRLKF
jgi:hypothetical protein